MKVSLGCEIASLTYMWRQEVRIETWLCRPEDFACRVDGIKRENEGESRDFRKDVKAGLEFVCKSTCVCVCTCVVRARMQAKA